MTNPQDRSQFRKIDTGNGIDRNLAATTNDRLEMTVIELQNLRENNTDQTKKLEKAITQLNATITDANDKNDRLQTKLFWITIIGTIFATSGLLQVLDILIRGIGK